MAFHCVNCNGSMVFDVEQQLMRCEHCGSTCEPRDFAFRDQGIAQADGTAADAGKIARFTCQNCGAELEGTEESVVGFCPYCGGQSMVASVSKSRPAERIIPFKVSKEQCAELYQNYAKGVRYLPKDFKDPEHIQKATGIYMPFYQYDAYFGDACIKGRKTIVSNSRYDEIAYYDTEGQVDATYERGVTFDASRYLDDQTSALVLPFDSADEKPFYPAYLSGFYADASSVDPGLYYDDATARAEQDMADAMGMQIRSDYGISQQPGSKVDTNITRFHSVLYPMWFITWRKDDRVAYAVVNGESGKVVSDLPLDLKSFAIGSVIITAVVFLLLELFLQPTPMLTSFISLAGAIFMAMGIRMGVTREYEQQSHANDKGWAGEDDDPNMDPEAREKARAKAQRQKQRREIGTTMGLVLGFGIALSVAFSFIKGGSNNNGIIVALKYLLPIVTLIYGITVLVRTLRWRQYLGRNYALIAVAVLMVTVIINSIITIIAPVNDGWYYIGDAICIVGLVLASIFMLRMYNLSTTRPLPKLFDRKEVQ